MTKPWGIYARVSTKRQADDGLSVEAQLDQLHTFAATRGYAVCEYKDKGKSGWKDDLNKRPAFKAMLDAVRAGELAGIIVTHLDRFSRNLIITLSTLGELGKLGAGFISLENSAFDFSRPADRLLMAVLGAFAQYYSDELSRKIKRGLAHRAAQGLRNGLLPFGYCNGHCVDCKPKSNDAPATCQHWNKVGKDNPILDEHDAPGVLLAFETYRASTLSFDRLSDTLNSAGYRSRTPQGRVLWNKHSVAEMLRNITYTGIVIHDGKEIPGKFPAIISRELFDEVQAIKNTRRFRSMTHSHKYRIYIFGGMIQCSGCGRVMRAQAVGKGRVQCYHCTSQELKQVVCHKPSAWIREGKLAAQFGEVIAQFKLPPDWLTRINELVNLNGKPSTHDTDKTTLTERLARLKRQYEWGDIGDQEYVTKRDEIKRALAECEPPTARLIIDAASILQNMTTVWQATTVEERRNMVRAILDYVICDPETGRLVALQPKQTFFPLFRQMQGLIENQERFEIISG